MRSPENLELFPEAERDPTVEEVEAMFIALHPSDRMEKRYQDKIENDPDFRRVLMDLMRGRAKDWGAEDTLQMATVTTNHFREKEKKPLDPEDTGDPWKNWELR